MKRITTALFSIILTSIAFGQYNFNEIEVWAGNIGSSPRYFAEVNGEMYFQAKFDYTTEIWKTDGTQIGTSMVVDLNGTFSSFI